MAYRVGEKIAYHKLFTTLHKSLIQNKIKYVLNKNFSLSIQQVYCFLCVYSYYKKCNREMLHLKYLAPQQNVLKT
jgi:hypothetical protein